MELIFIASGIALWVFFIAATGMVASSRGRSALAWGGLAVFFGFFALIVVAVLPAMQGGGVPANCTRCGNCGEIVRADAPVCFRCHKPMPPKDVRCPDCKELVHPEATICYHCRRTLTPRSVPAATDVSAAHAGRKV